MEIRECRLTPDQEAAYTLRRGGMGWATISNILGVSRKAAFELHRRARENIKFCSQYPELAGLPVRYIRELVKSNYTTRRQIMDSMRSGDLQRKTARIGP